MGNPNHFKKIIDDILEIMLADVRVYKFLHIPLQSASDRILLEMKRMYTLKDYQDIVLKARLKIPSITLANDIIVAYPTETDAEFKQTLDAIKQTNVLNFSRFWLRPNTPAQTMYTKEQFISGPESKQRAIVISQFFEKNAELLNRKWIGWTGKALVTENGKPGTNSFIVRNEYYKHIVVPKKKGINLGDTIEVRIDSVTKFDFLGVIL
jgi:tRNA A37 methylthiotransferase MiaB